MPTKTHAAEEYGPRLLLILRRTALFLSLVISIYGALAILDIVPGYKEQSLVAVGGISLLFLALGLLQYLRRQVSTADIHLYILSYHLLGSLFILWISGFDTPVTTTWVILMVVAGIYYGRRGFVGSFLLLAALASYEFLLYLPYEEGRMIGYLSHLATVGLIGAVLMQLTDIQRTERRRLQHSRAEGELQRNQLLTLINSLNLAVATTNAKGHVRLYNAAFLALLDTNQSLTGHALDDALHLSTSEGQAIDFRALTGTSVRPFERDDLILKLPDAEEIRLQISGAPIRGSYVGNKGAASVSGYVFVMRDVTKTKSLEEERDEFISVVSHELRTPITITEGTVSNLQLLLERGADTKTLAPALKDAHEQVTYLASMVNDLGTLSRAERGVGDEPEDIELNTLATELYQRYEPVAARKGLHLNLEAGRHLGSVSTSRLYLEEILQNFLTNAIKYTEKGSVTLRISRHGKRVEFAVTDTGIGISRGDQKHIYDKFYRSEDYRTRETSGTGLGLYVTSKLAHKLGIKIQLRSRLNHGSTFSFDLEEARSSNATSRP